MARKTKFPEKMIASLPEGTFTRIAAVLGKAEDRTEFVRDAVERELQRRKRAQSAEVR